MKITTVVFCVILFFCECKNSEEKAMEEVKKVEAKLYGDEKDFKFDEALARDAINTYKDYAEKNPESKQSPEMLLKAADLHRALKEYPQAVEIYKKIETAYPDFEKLPHIIFLQGFVYENEMHRLAEAKERYDYFLQKYPEHELANDVRFSLQNLGKTPEEIIRSFEQQDSAI
jgi:outer membrane protein assembly factor BamD (BamD/ComL family)